MLSKQECAQQLAKLNLNLNNPWEINADAKLAKEFKFKDFDQAWKFLGELAVYAEKHAHHPEWSNVYNLVTIELTTHDASGISDQDFALARFAEKACLAQL